jgi:hypothetical protein
MLSQPTVNCQKLRLVTASDKNITTNIDVTNNLTAATINGVNSYVVNYTFPAGTSYITFGMVGSGAEGAAYLHPTTSTVSSATYSTCKEGGWTHYYSDGLPQGSNTGAKRLFAVNWGPVPVPSDFYGISVVNTGMAANATVAAPYSKSYGANTTASVMGRSLQLFPEGATFSTPISVRIYFSRDEMDATIASVPNIQQKDLTWFQHEGDITATNNDNNGGTIKNATPLRNYTYGVDNGVPYVEINGIKNFSTFSYVVQNQGAPLPVTLSNFTAKAANCEAIVSWTGSVENNLASYIVQSSTTGTDNSFGDVQKINAKGSGSSYTSQFSITADNAYVRLKMTDNSGGITYSNILSISGNCASGMPVLYPNPVTNQLTIGNLGAGNKTIRIISTSGAVVYRNATGAQQINIGTQNWAAGAYLVSVQTAGGTVNTLKVVKQ